MKFIYAEYNENHNSIDITTFDGYLLRIDCNKAEDGLKTTLCSQCALDALAIDEPLEYARLCLEGNMQMWVDAEDSLELYWISILYVPRPLIIRWTWHISLPLICPKIPTIMLPST